MKDSKTLQAELITAILMERGCSRLNAAGHVMESIKNEYNAMQARLGCCNEVVIVDKGQLQNNLPDKN